MKDWKTKIKNLFLNKNKYVHIFVWVLNIILIALAFVSINDCSMQDNTAYALEDTTMIDQYLPYRGYITYSDVNQNPYTTIFGSNNTSYDDKILYVNLSQPEQTLIHCVFQPFLYVQSQDTIKFSYDRLGDYVGRIRETLTIHYVFSGSEVLTHTVEKVSEAIDDDGIDIAVELYNLSFEHNRSDLLITYIEYISIYVDDVYTVSGNVDFRIVFDEVMPYEQYALTFAERVEEVAFGAGIQAPVNQIVGATNSFLQIELLPGLTFATLIAILVAIPLAVAILKLWLGG